MSIDPAPRHTAQGANLQRQFIAPLAVTMGDPSGIGIEITLAAWIERHQRQLAPFAVFGCVSTLADRAEAIGVKVPIQRINETSAAAAVFAQALPVVDIPTPAAVLPGLPNTANAAAIIASIERSTAAVVRGEASAVVTNPIAKNVLYASGFRHPGHTEFLGVLASQHHPGQVFTPVMMLCCEELRVVPLTVHVALANVPGMITSSLIATTVRIVHASLQRDFGVASPRIAIAGLNPHAGESGTIGAEDEAIVRPAVRRLVGDGFTVTGPHSADTLFHEASRRNYDAVVAMYHDQALIPIKTLAFDRGVNVTLGLPFVRTSPDHGTAFDIAGRGVASAESLIQAIKLAGAMAQSRAAETLTA